MNAKNIYLLPVGRESKGVDRVIVVKGVEMLAIIQVPKHGLGVLTAGSAKRTVW
jgi:hypothetical protein